MDSFLSEEDFEILNRSKKYRLKMTEKLFEDGTPDSTREMRMANELLSSLDESILKLAKLTQDQKKNASDDAFNNTLISIIKNTKKESNERRNLTLPDKDIDMLESELREPGRELSPADFIDGDNDE